MNTKKIGLFLKSLTPEEYLYMQHCMAISDGVKSLCRNHKVSKSEICSIFSIKENQYGDFISGNFEYNLRHMAELNAAFMEYSMRGLEKNVPFQTPEKK